MVSLEDCPNAACLANIRHIDDRITEIEHEIGGNGQPGIRKDVHTLTTMSREHSGSLTALKRDVEWIKRLVFVAIGWAAATDLGIVELIKGLG